MSIVPILHVFFCIILGRLPISQYLSQQLLQQALNIQPFQRNSVVFFIADINK